MSDKECQQFRSILCRGSWLITDKSQSSQSYGFVTFTLNISFTWPLYGCPLSCSNSMHFAGDYLPLADEWVGWDNSRPPHQRRADSTTHRPEEISAMLESSNVKEDAPVEPPEFVRIGLEASRVATLKWLDFYRRMGIEVTPEMTLVKKKPIAETKP